MTTKERMRMTGMLLYHSKLLSEGKVEAAFEYAVRRKLMVDNVTSAAAPAERSEGTPGGEGVAVAEGASNWDSSTTPEKILGKATPSKTTSTNEQANDVATVTEAILSPVEAELGPTHTLVATEQPEAVRETIGGIARERCPEGVYWAQVTSDQMNRLRKNIRLHPSGEEGLLHVSYRMCVRLGDKLKFEWFPVTHSREPGQEKAWVVYNGPMIP